MRMRLFSAMLLAPLLLLLPISTGSALAQYVSKNGDAWPRTYMSPARSSDAYAIYSLLLPAEFPGTELAHSPLWLVAGTTVVGHEEVSDPYKGLTVPLAQQKAFAAVLQDYEQHKHTYVRLEKKFLVGTPYLLLDRADREEFKKAWQASRNAQTDLLPARYKGAMGLISFSYVYFNFEHTLAMVYLSHWCGANCGGARWIALQKNDGGWRELP